MIPATIRFGHENIPRELEVMLPQVPQKGDRMVLGGVEEIRWRVNEVTWIVPPQNARVRVIIEVGF